MKTLKRTVFLGLIFLPAITVQNHIFNIYKKLQVHSKIEAVQKAKNHNII